MAPPKDLDQWIKDKLFHAVPMGIAVIDRSFNVVYANPAFQDMFGEWRSRKCYDVYKDRDSICPDCKGSKTFQDGRPRINEEIGYDKNGKPTRYIKHTVPMVDDDGNIPYLVEMSTNITEAAQIRREYELLFDHIPCNILLIDRDFRILKANRHMKRLLGDVKGKHCFQGLKGCNDACLECTARQTFEDGRQHSGHHIWKSRTGNTVHLHVITLPIRTENGRVEVVMEMAVDVTQTLELEEGLKFAHSFLKTIITTSMDGIFAVDENGTITLINPAASELFGIADNGSITGEEIAAMLPTGIMEHVPEEAHPTLVPESIIKNLQGDELPVRLFGNKLLIDGVYRGMAFSMQNLSEIKRLEKEKLEAERLAAVGQTVAGLAHGIKNLINALEGGLYMLNTGIGKGDFGRVTKGMEMLTRNIDRISTFAKAFLDFSKAREIQVKLNRPDEVVAEVMDMYAAKASEHGILLKCEAIGPIRPVLIDYEKIHECLTNLVGNAIDACLACNNDSGSHITVRTLEDNDTLVYEIIDDGCGMDDEIKQKVFTTFFTTKGLGGTGIGLLMTKKIIHEHGGSIELMSEPGRGTTFRILLPRQRLPKVG